MASFKEIVTKAVIGKGKKTFTTTNSVVPECEASTILGCWVINHNFKGYKSGDTITVEGSYDINISLISFCCNIYCIREIFRRIRFI